MKKRIAVLLTAIMVIAMGTTAFASSPTTETTDTATAPATEYASGVTIADKGITIDGAAADVEVEIKTVTKAQVDAAQAEAVKSVAETAKVLKMVDVKLPEGTTYEKVTITFNVSGVKANQKISVLHFDEKNNKWDAPITPDAVGDGTVTATFTSLSPIAIVAHETSAQTGETPVLPIMMIICLAGVIVCGTKVKFNR